MKNVKAFTLIELLIVVAIIAILAAIAVPNFLEAQTRSKVSRVKSDMRSLATAIEAYQVDWNKYPYDGSQGGEFLGTTFNFWHLPITLTTPVAYMTNVSFNDPFRETQQTFWQDGNIRYTSIGSTWGTDFDSAFAGSVSESAFFEGLSATFGGWRLSSAGPDGEFGPPNADNPTDSWPAVAITEFSYPGQLPQPYDPTNGTVSDGDIIRLFFFLVR